MCGLKGCCLPPCSASVVRLFCKCLGQVFVSFSSTPSVKLILMHGSFVREQKKDKNHRLDGPSRLSLSFFLWPRLSDSFFSSALFYCSLWKSFIWLLVVMKFRPRLALFWYTWFVLQHRGHSESLGHSTNPAWALLFLLKVCNYRMFNACSKMTFVLCIVSIILSLSTGLLIFRIFPYKVAKL